METLIPDFKGDKELVFRFAESLPDVVSHNVETVQRLTRQVRVQARYERSLEVLSWLKEAGVPRTKSGIMLGLGESTEELIQAMDDLRQSGVDILTLGQYLQPSRKHLEVSRYYSPDEFESLKEIALQKGFRVVESGPMVRSSYHAEKHVFPLQ